MQAIHVILCLVAAAFAQDLDASVNATVQWPQNDDSPAGALVEFAYSNVGDGSCFVDLNGGVTLFHVMNGHIVPGDDTDPIQGQYKIAAPASWEMVNGSLQALVIFGRDDVRNVSDFEFRCDPEDVVDLSIYSFPQNTEVKETSSNVYYRPGYHSGDELTITLPTAVERFNITGADSRMEVTADDSGLVYTVSGFVNEAGNDYHKEVHFNLHYLITDEENPTANWFSAGDVTVVVVQAEDSEEG